MPSDALRPRADGWELLEREHEREQIGAALAATGRGQGRFALIYGPWGIGRSSLLRAAVLDAQVRDIAVLQACGTEFERGYGFGIVRQLLEERVVSLRDAERRTLLADLGPAGAAALGIGHADPREAGSAFEQIKSVYRLITRMAAEKPLLVCVDDLQWCDRPSLDFLCFLGHRAPRLPVMIIAAWRRGEPGVQAGRLQALAGKSDTLFLSPGSLSADAVRSLLRRGLGSEPDDEAVALVHDRTAGWPLLASELVEGLRLRGVGAQRGCSQAIRDVTPESLRRDIVARLGRHPEAVQRLARGLAVMGEASLAQAAALTGIEEDKSRAAAAALVRAGILHDDATVSYAQPLLRAAVYDTLSSLEAADWHRQVAGVLCDAGAGAGPIDPRRVAAHLLRCEPSGDRRFGQLLLESARLAAEAGLADDEQRYLVRALGEFDDVTLRGSTLVRLAERERRAGDLASAALHAAEAMSLAGAPAERVAAGLMAAQSSAGLAGVPAALTLLDSEVSAIGSDDADASRALEAAAAVLRVCVDMPSGITPQNPGNERPTGEVSAPRALLAACASHLVISGSGSARGVREHCARALCDTGRELGAGFSEISDYLACRAAILADAGDLVAPTLVDARGREWALAGLAIRSQLALSRGELSAARSDARAGLALTRDLPPGALALRIRRDLLAALVLIGIEEGRLEQAQAALAELETSADAAAQLIAPLHIALALARSAPVDAAGYAAEAEDGPAGFIGPGICWRPLAALARQANGDHQSALALASAHVAHARGWGAASLLGRALVVRAIVDPGSRRVRFAQDAVAVLEETSWHLELARARIELGAALRRAGRRREAREQLMPGADLAHRCGALALSAQARAELIAVGARPRRAAFSGVGALTLSELRVAQLAATGLTNREIAQELVVSARTISSQLTAIYRKVDVHNRAALTEAMERFGDDDRPRAETIPL